MRDAERIIDKVKIYVKAGNGGNGAVAFHREKYVARGGPSGGDGGHGGHVVFKVDPGATTLLFFRDHRKFVAKNGGDGQGEKFHGANGQNVEILVPLGTLIRDAETGKIIKDMSDDQPFICCKGGRGGWGNRHFASPTRQLPMFAKPGTKGEERELILELKMLADVGLIGMPSVGKSSILSRISSARPKIAAYHFTTLSPNLGVVRTGGEAGFVAADIPGLIEGAAEGAGLGHAFLRHIERCRLLLHVVDISCEEGRDPIEDIRVINGELSRYSEKLAALPQMIVANKADALDEELVDVKAFEAYVRENGWELMYVSAATGDNLKELVTTVAKRLADLPPVTVFETELNVEEEIEEIDRDAITVRRENNDFYVEGPWLTELVESINFTDYESLAYFEKTLIRRGVIKLLEEKGCTDGHTVHIYDFEFDFVK
ncbi:MAG: GTPase ObgE [Clostridia bacterium]|nr:GTPase ObgE [Clostridia bacterium]